MGRTVWRAAGLLAAANGLALVLQFLTTVLMARTFGTSAAMDAYTVAVTIPESIQVLLMLASLSVIFTPFFIEARTLHGDGEAWSMALSLLLIVIGSCILVIPLLMLAMPWLLGLLVPGFDAETLALAVQLSNLILPGLVYYATAGILLGICYGYRDFLTAALNTLLLAALNLTAFLVFVQALGWGVQGMMLGRLFALLVLFVFLSWRVWRHKPKVPLSIRLRHPRAWNTLSFLPPYLFGVFAGQIQLFITRGVVSTLGAGSVAAWGYGQRLADIPMAMLGAALGAAYLPDFATQVAKGNTGDAREQWDRAVLNMMLILTPVAALVVTMSVPLVALLFQRGEFDATATMNTAAVLAGLTVGLPLRGVGGLLVRGMPAFRTRWLPMILSCFSVGGTLLFLWLLVGRFGIGGAALSVSIGDSLFAIVGVFVFWRWLQSQTWGRELGEVAKIVLAAGAAGTVSYFAAGLNWSAFVSWQTGVWIVQVGAATLAGAAVFVALVIVLRVQGAAELLSLILQRAQSKLAGAR
jgi:putative peptidoglycan lipid II flippase